MIYLASSSQTRAEILNDAKVDFKQIDFSFDESVVDKNISPNLYVLSVAKAKKQQFMSVHKELKNVLFADSCVVCNGETLGKPKNYDDAFKMLMIQSDNYAKVLTAMIFLGEKFELLNVSQTTFKFAKFDEKLVDEYIKSGLCMDKAGAMMIEGFNKQYIIHQDGNTSTARGLNVEILKAFL